MRPKTREVLTPIAPAIGTLAGTIGCWLITEDWSHFFGYLAILESLLIAIEFGG